MQTSVFQLLTNVLSWSSLIVMKLPSQSKHIGKAPGIKQNFICKMNLARRVREEVLKDGPIHRQP
uniref:Uncharacterized protein n=1 Tax=Arion vulgaris TaxID=1028688 RepID=A0A0B6ZS51_9EUPU